MDQYLEPYWNLEQVRSWAETRDAEAVRFAAIPKQGSPATGLECVHEATRLQHKARENGRDVNEWLWIESGWQKPNRIEERVVEIIAEGVNIWPIFDEEYVEQLNQLEKLGKIRTKQFNGFPTVEYLMRLFRSGRLKATGNLPGDPKAYEISVADWGALEVACGGDLRRLGVWRTGLASIARKGDFDNVRVDREAVMKAFPAELPPVAPGLQLATHEAEVRDLIRLELGKHGGFLSQENGAKIVRSKFPSFPKKRAMELVKEATGNDKPGPRGPRKKSCG